ncbi:dephospho-CoA kinase [Bombiscardovia nodaiensis]|uniref:Dephospho-CoA kinase n=1 Tax=Bombiscardovia nodaiensis TaxID=2932181 RepID=A0ABM8B7P1_9BIFI|nr:dephospho-CoA kinase [Bombiscardovia nodaiensis]
MLRVGLTGGIAAGKSTVAQHLAQLGAVLIDYDGIAHELMARGGAAVGPIREAFGPQAVGTDGAVDRAWLAQAVFSDNRLRERINALTHPLIFRQAAQLEQEYCSQPQVVVHDVPLLADVWQTQPFSFAHVLSVEAPEEVRIARMVNVRHMSQAQAVARVRSQATQAQRKQIADIIIDSSLPVEQMFEHLDKIYSGLSRQAGEGKPV